MVVEFALVPDTPVLAVSSTVPCGVWSGWLSEYMPH
jgi:hypothetical protein